MSGGAKKTSSNGVEKTLTTEEEQKKIQEVRKLVGKVPEKLWVFSSDASILRYLRARNWNVKKSTKMLKETLKWRVEYKPEEIRWDEVAKEAETGKIYRTNYIDKHGRTVLVMRPSRQNSKSTKGQIKYLVYCMENAIMNLPPVQEQMVWLIDFAGFNLSHISLKVTRETAHVLQDHYPERLGVAILYNPPKFFEPFWMAAKAFLEPKTYNKVKFVYSDEANTMKIMEDLFHMENLESAFGGKSDSDFEISKYAERMMEDDKKVAPFWASFNASSQTPQEVLTTAASLESLNVDSDSDASENNKADSSPSREIDSVVGSADSNMPATGSEKHVHQDESVAHGNDIIHA